MTDQKPSSVAPQVIPPTLDFSRIPEEYEGLWLVIRQTDQSILGKGDTLRKALRESGRTENDPSIVVTRVQTEPMTLVIHQK